MSHRILILNMGSTSTKVAVYSDLNEEINISVKHSKEDLSHFSDIWEQKEFRKGIVKKVLKDNGYKLTDFSAISCRGGLIRPVPSGVYLLNEKMIEDIKSERYGIHPTNVGNVIAYELGKEARIPVVIVDPPVSDELCELARFSGIKEIKRASKYHTLNQKQAARLVSKKLGKNYKDLNMIVVHLGGGISVGAHERGKVIDVNNALDGDGPFSPESAGSLPVGDLIKMCFSGKYTAKEMLTKIRGKGGLVSYLGTNSTIEVEKRIKDGDEYAKLVYEAMAYQVAKEIGAAATVLKGKVNCIVLTGGVANSKMVTNWIKERVEFIAPVYIMPGENEMLSLAENTLRYLCGEIEAKEY